MEFSVIIHSPRTQPSVSEMKKVIIKPDFKKVKKAVLVSTILIIIIVNSLYMIFLREGSFRIDFQNIFLFFGLLLIGIFIHELIHFIGFLFLTEAKFADIKIGFKSFSPYVYCKKKVKLKGFRVAIILPLIVTGIAPVLIGFYIKSLMVINIGCLLIASGLGDFVGFLYMLKIPSNAFIQDYEDELGSEICLV